MRRVNQQKKDYIALTLLVMTTVSLLVACSAIPPAETGGPRPAQPTYPLVLSEDAERREATLSAAAGFLSTIGAAGEVELQPVTSTIASLPAGRPLPIYLPKLGTAEVMNEEEVRESLRRFLVEWRNIIGADPAHLSLVDRVTEPDGTQVANYEQRPFRHPLRGRFGKLQIRFTNDRRVLNITSTCIPEAESLQSMLGAITPTVKPEDAEQHILENGVNFTDSAGRARTFKPSAAQVEVRELVFYVTSSPDTLEFHLAWAVEVTEAAVKIIYLDAVKAEILGQE